MILNGYRQEGVCGDGEGKGRGRRSALPCCLPVCRPSSRQVDFARAAGRNAEEGNAEGRADSDPMIGPRAKQSRPVRQAKPGQYANTLEGLDTPLLSTKARLTSGPPFAITTAIANITTDRIAFSEPHTSPPPHAKRLHRPRARRL